MRLGASHSSLMRPLSGSRLRATWGSLRGDQALRGRIVNVGHLLSGNLTGTLIGVVSIALAGRALGPTHYGMLALILSYVSAIDRLMRFESWQPLIKYAADIEGPDRLERLCELLAFGLRLDMAAAGTATVTAMLLACAAGPLFGLSAEHLAGVLLFATSLAFNITGVPTAVLRMAGRFRLIAYVQISGNLLRMALCIVGFYYGWGLLFFVVAWTVAQIFGQLLFLAIGWRQMHREGVRGIIFLPLKGVTKRFPGIMNFAWTSNLSTTIRSSSSEMDTLLVGALADPRSAGLYYIAKRLAWMAQQVCGQVQAVLYPDIVRLWAARSYRAFEQAVSQVQLILAAFGIGAFLFLALFGKLLLAIGPGAAYASALPLLLVQIVAVTLAMHAAPSRAALLAMGRQQRVLQIVFVATAAFHMTALILIPRIGAMGANIAHVVLGLLAAGMMEWVFRRDVRARRVTGDPTPAGLAMPETVPSAARS